MLVKSVTRSILCLAAVASALPQGPRPDASQLQALGSPRGHTGTGANPAAEAARLAMHPGADSELQGAADEWDQGPDDDAEVPDSGAGGGGYGKPSQTYGSDTPDEPVTPPGGYNKPEQSYGSDVPDEPVDQPTPGGYGKPDQTYGGGGVPDEPVDQPDQTYGGGGGGGYGSPDDEGGYGGGGGGFGGQGGFPQGGGFPGGFPQGGPGLGGGFGGGIGPQAFGGPGGFPALPPPGFGGGVPAGLGLPPPGIGGGVPAFAAQGPCNSPFCGIPNLNGPQAVPVAPHPAGGFLSGIPVLGGFLPKKK